MAERGTRAAGFWPRQTVRVATLALPRGVSRDRYRQELLAELCGLGRARQYRHVLGVLSRCWALRAALNTPALAPAADLEIEFPRRRRALFCRLNLRHRWASMRTEDGSRYLRCQRCGKDETDIHGGSKSAPDFDGVNGSWFSGGFGST